MPARWRPIIICLALMALALAAYWPVTHAEFVSWDDTDIVLKNPALEKPFMDWLAHPYKGMFMPLTQTTYQAMAAMGKLSEPVNGYSYNPLVFHWVMIFIRLLNIPVIFLLLRKIVGDDWAAGAGAALVALHPVGDEAIAWITEVSTPLCTFFVAACLWQWLCYRQAKHHPRWHYWAAVILYLLALLSKPQVIGIVVMIVALDLCVAKLNWKQSVRSWWWWILPAAGLAIYMKRLQPPQLGVWVTPLWQRPLIAMDAVVFYLGKILVPWNLGIDYGRTPQWVLNQHRMLALEALAVVLIILLLWRARKTRLVYLLSGVIFLAGMAAVLGLTPFWFQSYSTVADRYIYLPLIGVGLLLAEMLAGVRNFLAWTAVGAGVLICTVLMYGQTQYWHDSYGLYEHAIMVHPHGWVAWSNTAYMLVSDGDPVDALVLAHEAYALDSQPLDTYSTIGTALAIMGDVTQAIPYLRHVIYARPEEAVTAMNLGAAYVQLHQYDLGIKWLEYSLKYNATSKKAQRLLAGAIQLRDYAKRSPSHPKETTSTTRP